MRWFVGVLAAPMIVAWGTYFSVLRRAEPAVRAAHINWMEEMDDGADFCHSFAHAGNNEYHRRLKEKFDPMHIFNPGLIDRKL